MLINVYKMINLVIIQVGIFKMLLNLMVDCFINIEAYFRCLDICPYALLIQRLHQFQMMFSPSMDLILIFFTKF